MLHYNDQFDNTVKLEHQGIRLLKQFRFPVSQNLVIMKSQTEIDRLGSQRVPSKSGTHLKYLGLKRDDI